MDRSGAAAQRSDRAAARVRLARLEEQLHAARRADEVMPLAVYYGPRPVRTLPLAELLDEGPWAA
jgi:hypothetical protein